jgi:hypothetical protein
MGDMGGKGHKINNGHHKCSGHHDHTSFGFGDGSNQNTHWVEAQVARVTVNYN